MEKETARAVVVVCCALIAVSYVVWLGVMARNDHQTKVQMLDEFRLYATAQRMGNDDAQG